MLLNYCKDLLVSLQPVFIPSWPNCRIQYRRLHWLPLSSLSITPCRQSQWEPKSRNTKTESPETDWNASSLLASLFPSASLPPLLWEPGCPQWKIKKDLTLNYTRRDDIFFPAVSNYRCKKKKRYDKQPLKQSLPECNFTLFFASRWPSSWLLDERDCVFLI